MSNGLNTPKLFIGAINELRRNFMLYLSYKMLFFLLSFIILSPLSGVIFSFLTQARNQTAITNEYMASYLFSLRGFVTILAWGTITFFLIFTEQAGVIFMSSHTYGQNSSPMKATFSLLLRHIMAILRLGASLFVRYLLFSLPFLAVWGATFFVFLSEYDINYYLAKRPPAFWIALAIGGINLLAYIILLLRYLTRWIFALHVLLLKKNTRPHIFQTSETLSRGIGMALMKLFLIWLLGAWLFITITATGLAFTNGLMLNILAATPHLAVPIMALLYAFDFIITTFFISLSLPILLIMLTKVYYQRLSETDVVAQSSDDPSTGSSEEPLEFSRLQRRMPWIALALFLICVMIFGISIASDMNQPDTVEVTAHRGSSAKAPENSLSAIQQAIEDGADYAEIDVQETADGVIVVVHDGDLMRVTGQPLLLHETPYEQVKKLDAGSWFSPEFKGERIPTLEEVINLARGKIKLNIELKFNGFAKQLTERTVAIVQQQDFIEQCVITSLKYDAVLKAKQLDDRLQVGYIMYGSIGSPFRLESDFFSVSKEMISASFISRSHAHGKDVHVWTYSDTPNSLERFMYMGVDNIITDYPAELVAVLKRRAKMDDIERMKENFIKWLER